MSAWFKGRETEADDAERSRRLVQGVEAAYAARTGDPVGGGELTVFEEVVLFGAWPGTVDVYPPAGHGYPMRRV
ncbi:hypothetical protein [Streptomyces sp. NPDC048188]|uniref:hypothetical protein n=1 Tax=Streptomyces sp. NPDC048188 TaxID=3155749 RepID=UPI003446815D